MDWEQLAKMGPACVHLSQQINFSYCLQSPNLSRPALVPNSIACCSWHRRRKRLWQRNREVSFAVSYRKRGENLSAFTGCVKIITFLASKEFYNSSFIGQQEVFRKSRKARRSEPKKGKKGGTFVSLSVALIDEPKIKISYELRNVPGI